MHNLSGQIQNLQEDLTYLQLYTTNRQEAGFFDMPSLVEAFALHSFNALYDLNLVNANLIAVNFPTVDLIDSENKVAVQVTTTADSNKIRSTIEKFEAVDVNTKRSLKDDYKKLIIFGFCKLTQPRKAFPAYCELVNVSTIIKRLTQKNSLQMVESISNTISQHTSYDKLHPWQDVPSLKVLVSYMDRPAFHHGMRHEGSVVELSNALTDVNELIGNGTLKGRSKCKPIFKLAEDIQDLLLPVKKKISDMQRLVNVPFDHSQRHNLYSHENREAIDSIRLSILADISNIARRYSIKISF